MSDWRSPALLVPAIAAVLSAILGLTGVLIASNSHPPLDCTAARLAVSEAFDAHPEAKAPFPPDSEEQTRCALNDYLNQLKESP